MQNATVVTMQYGKLGTLFDFCGLLFRNRTNFSKEELEFIAGYFAKQVRKTYCALNIHCMYKLVVNNIYCTYNYS